jgi:hypothetical protein
MKRILDVFVFLAILAGLLILPGLGPRSGLGIWGWGAGLLAWLAYWKLATYVFRHGSRKKTDE